MELIHSTRVLAQKAAERHQHKRHRAVAADEVAHATLDRGVDHVGFTGSRMMTASSFMRSDEAASIQYPRQPAARSFGCTASV